MRDGPNRRSERSGLVGPKVGEVAGRAVAARKEGDVVDRIEHEAGAIASDRMRPACRDLLPAALGHAVGPDFVEGEPAVARVVVAVDHQELAVDAVPGDRDASSRARLVSSSQPGPRPSGGREGPQVVAAIAAATAREHEHRSVDRIPGRAAVARWTSRTGDAHRRPGIGGRAVCRNSGPVDDQQALADGVPHRGGACRWRGAGRTQQSPDASARHEAPELVHKSAVYDVPAPDEHLVIGAIPGTAGTVEARGGCGRGRQQLAPAVGSRVVGPHVAAAARATEFEHELVGVIPGRDRPLAAGRGRSTRRPLRPRTCSYLANADRTSFVIRGGGKLRNVAVVVPDVAREVLLVVDRDLIARVVERRDPLIHAVLREGRVVSGR